MSEDASQQLHVRGCHASEIAANDPHDICAAEMQHDAIRRVELNLANSAVIEGLRVAILLAELQHGSPVADAPQPSERAEVINLAFIAGRGFGVVAITADIRWRILSVIEHLFSFL